MNATLSSSGTPLSKNTLMVPWPSPVFSITSPTMRPLDEKFGGIAPKFLVIELPAVPQPHHQRRIDRLWFARKRVGDEDLGVGRKGPLAAILRGEDQMPPLRRVLGNAQ